MSIQMCKWNDVKCVFVFFVAGVLNSSSEHQCFIVPYVSAFLFNLFRYLQIFINLLCVL